MKHILFDLCVDKVGSLVSGEWDDRNVIFMACFWLGYDILGLKKHLTIR